MDEKLKCPHKRIDHNLECLDCDEPVWVDQTTTPIDKALDMTKVTAAVMKVWADREILNRIIGERIKK